LAGAKGSPAGRSLGSTHTPSDGPITPTTRTAWQHPPPGIGRTSQHALVHHHRGIVQERDRTSGR
jgi:hypothetical protein